MMNLEEMDIIYLMVTLLISIMSIQCIFRSDITTFVLIDSETPTARINVNYK